MNTNDPQDGTKEPLDPFDTQEATTTSTEAIPAMPDDPFAPVEEPKENTAENTEPEKKQDTDDLDFSKMSSADTSASKAMEKDQDIPLTEGHPDLNTIMIGLGWDAPATTGENDEFDLDSSAFLIGTEGRVHEDTDFIFYNNLETAEGAIKHYGDNTDGKEDGDNEIIVVKLKDIPFNIISVVFVVTIHEGEEYSQHFGLVENAYIRLVDVENNKELLRYNLTEDATDTNALILGEFTRDGMEWKFHTIGEAKTGGLYEVAKGYGVYVAPT